MINYELIEKYFSNNLSSEELLEFENFYQSSTEFKHEIDFLKNVRLVSEKEDDEQFKKQLVSYEEDFSIKKKKSIKWWKPLSAAAVVLMVLGMSFLYSNSKSNQELFAAYFEASKNVSAPIVRSDIDETIVNKAFVAYSEGNYKEALPLFEKAFNYSHDSELLFYEGNSLLAIGNTNDAIEKFKNHLTNSDALTQRSHWYLALAYLKINDTEKAKVELNNIIDSGEKFKYEEANSLLKELE